MNLYGNRLKYVTSKIWDATRPDFVFPEVGDPELKWDGIQARPNTGVAFSGGGNRAASATLGQLRGLSELGLLKSVRYISCVSGGSWACAPFTYLPGTWTDETFLGPVIDPAQLTLDHLEKTDRNSLAHAIANSLILDDFLKEALRLAGDETYSRAVGDIFLKSFDVDSLERFFSLDDKSVAAIRQRNAQMTAGDFCRARSGRPFLIVGQTLLRTDNPAPLPTRIHFETTPLYAGAKALHPKAGSGGRDLGGGYVEPFGFDSDEPDAPPGPGPTVTVRLGTGRHRYTLSNVIGTSGAAPAEILAKLHLDWLGFPEFRYWTPSAPTAAGSREYEFGDGGILENLGIMPLLMRRVERIVVFVNTMNRLKGAAKGEINDSIAPLFGCAPGFADNHVFPRERYEPLVEAVLARKRDGKTVLCMDTCPVLANRCYGIDGGWETQILWVYNERVAEWERLLPPRIAGMIGSGSLGNFPNYRTFFQNPPAVIDLSAKQVNMLANLSCWNVMTNAAAFEQMLA